MEPISVSFEAGEPAPGRELMQQAQGGHSSNLSQRLRLQATLFRVWQISLFMETQWGDVLQGRLPPRESNFLF